MLQEEGMVVSAPHLCQWAHINKGAVTGTMEFGLAGLILFYCVTLVCSLELVVHCCRCSHFWNPPPTHTQGLPHVVWLSRLLHFHVHSASTLVFLTRTKATCSSFFPSSLPPLCLSIISLRLLLSFSTIMRTIFCLFTLPLLCPKWTAVTAGPVLLTPSKTWAWWRWRSHIATSCVLQCNFRIWSCQTAVFGIHEPV